jgi:hypothetical protein
MGHVKTQKYKNHPRVFPPIILLYKYGIEPLPHKKLENHPKKVA